MAEMRISIAEPVSELRRVKIRENGEPLVDFLERCPDLRLDRPRFHYRRETMLRQSVAERLCEANAVLMRRGLRIHVIEGWRPPFIQGRMYAAVWKQFANRFPNRSETSLRRTVNQFTAPLNPRVPPPHTTGGAVDITLCDVDGQYQDLFSPFGPYDPKGFFTDALHLSDQARENRAILGAAMNGAGLTNYPSEYWHWTYGDQGWAYRGGHPNALYSAIEPPGWAPDPVDVVDAPLEFIDPEAME